jgi:hypothetical protein
MKTRGLTFDGRRFIWDLFRSFDVDKNHNRPRTYQLQRSATEPSSTCHCIRFFYTICWMYRYRLQIKWESKKINCSSLQHVLSPLLSCSNFPFFWLPSKTHWTNPQGGGYLTPISYSSLLNYLEDTLLTVAASRYKASAQTCFNTDYTKNNCAVCQIAIYAKKKKKSKGDQPFSRLLV